MASNNSALTLVFEAAADAPIAGKLADITATLKTDQPNPVSGFLDVAGIKINGIGCLPTVLMAYRLIGASMK